MSFRVAFLAAALGGLAWFQFAQDASATALSQRAEDMLDSRPTKTVLIIGNSRTYVNDMPAMLRQLAQQPEAPINIEVESSTGGGFSFENHWAKPRTARLLSAGWDEVILQGESGAQVSREQYELFHAYGQKLAAVARVREGRPTLLVNWPYDPSYFKDYQPYDRSEHLSWLREVHRRLANDAKLDRLNLGSLWESVRVANPSLPLTSDGNHPTVAGSYLYALAVYTYVTGQPVTPLAYVPAGLDPVVAKMLREAVDSYPVAMS